MFVCLECGEIFDEPSTWKEDRGECFGFPTYETMSGCPDCGGAYTEAHECDCCGEWITTDYIKTEDGQRICENCYTSYSLGDENN